MATTKKKTDGKRSQKVAEQLRAYERSGVDQLVFGVPGDLEHDEAIECIELFGTRVIHEFDKDPVHRTTHQRAAVAGA